MFINKHLEENGIRLKDAIHLAPIYGKKRLIQCQRTNYLICDEQNPVVANEFNSIILPAMKNEKFHLELKLTHPENLISHNEENCRYMLKSQNGIPFNLNGQYVMSAFLERGDQVHIGENILDFNGPKVICKSFLQIDLNLYHKIIHSPLPILIEGETGTGKTFLAREIHQASGRKGKFVHINISSFSRNLVESELFGHKKGAFTGAMNDKVGAFEEANGGTLFIDEIDSLPWDLQTKLLLFLDDHKIRAVGSNQNKQIKTRLIFSSGQNLKQLLNKGKIRTDFYYRLNSGQSFYLNSLRSQPELIAKFCEKFAIDEGVHISSRLVKFYQTLPWPGNFRQLKSQLERKKVTSNHHKLDFDDCDQSLITQNTDLMNFTLDKEFLSLESMKLRYCLSVYHHFNQNVSLAAQKLEINPKTLRKLIRSQECQRP